MSWLISEDGTYLMLMRFLFTKSICAKAAGPSGVATILKVELSKYDPMLLPPKLWHECNKTS